MKAARFDYLRPKTLSEASTALAREDLSTAAIAGGQSLIPMLSLRVALPDLIVDLGRLAELKDGAETATHIALGALTTHAAIEDGKTPDPFNGLMRRVAGGISYRAVRNHGTIGGSVALADPAADWPGCLMVLNATVRIAGTIGTRSEPVAGFIRDTYETSLKPGEIVVGFDIPKPEAPLRWGFAKVARKSGAFASAIAIVAAQGRGGPVSVVVTGAATRAVHFSATSEVLSNDSAGEESLRVAIAKDLNMHAPEADPYQQRLHRATVLRAIREMRAQ